MPVSFGRIVQARDTCDVAAVALGCESLPEISHDRAGVAADVDAEAPVRIVGVVALVDELVERELAAEAEEELVRPGRCADPAGQVQPAQPQLLLVVGPAPPQGDRHHPARHDVGGGRAGRRVDIEGGGVPADDHVVEHVLAELVLHLVDHGDRRDRAPDQPVDDEERDVAVGLQRAAVGSGHGVVEVVQGAAGIPHEREDGHERVEEAGVAALARAVRLGQLDGGRDRLHHEEQLR